MQKLSTQRRLAMSPRTLLALAGLAVAAFPTYQALAARNNKTTVVGMDAGYIPAHGKSVVLVLPIQTAEGWRANSLFTQALKQRASGSLNNALKNTGQFSLVQVNRFNPIFQRGVSDELYSQEDFDAVLNDPTTETARGLMSKLTFNRAPKLPFGGNQYMVQVVLDELLANTAGRPTGVRATGNLYSIGENETTLFRTKTVTVPLSTVGVQPVPSAVRGATVAYRSSDLILGALNNAFNQIARDLSKPVIEAEMPFSTPADGDVVPAATPAPQPAPANPDNPPPAIPTEAPPQ